MKTKSVSGKSWKRSISISSDKYAPVSKAILKVLTREPIQFTPLLAKVEKEVKDFPGSVGWHTVGILRQLEKEGKIVRNKGKVVTYFKK